MILLGTSRELRDALGTLRDGVLGQFTRQDETDSGLDLAGRDRRLLGVLSQTRGLLSDALKDIINERVEDGHGLVRNTGIRVDLLQHLVDVRGVGLLAGLLALLLVGVSGSFGGSLLASGRGLFGSCLFSGLGWGLSSGGGWLLSFGCGCHLEFECVG